MFGRHHTPPAPTAERGCCWVTGGSGAICAHHGRDVRDVATREARAGYYRAPDSDLSAIAWIDRNRGDSATPDRYQDRRVRP